MQPPATAALRTLADRIAAASEQAHGDPGAVRLLAVSKAKPAAAIRALAGAGQHAFGENYLQEAGAKIDALADLGIEWHFIGGLQSNKCRDVARRFDWAQSVDRERLLAPLAAGRAHGAAPLQVLLQVNIDGEDGKSGCAPDAVDALAAMVAMHPQLRLRGLMAIPAPAGVRAQRRAPFAAMRRLFDALRSQHPQVDTLSMGMSDDFEDAIAEGATMVRIGTALFGPR